METIINNQTIMQFGSKLCDKDLEILIRQLIDMYKNREVRTVEVVYNSDYGGIDFSKEFITQLRLKSPKLANEIEMSDGYISSEVRTDPIVIELIKQLKSQAAGPNACLDIQTVTLKKGEYIFISEYDGKEEVHVKSSFGY